MAPPKQHHKYALQSIINQTISTQSLAPQKTEIANPASAISTR
jgi:hypothetical protein